MDLKTSKILIIHHGALGDFVLSLPALISLKYFFQKNHILYLDTKDKHIFWQQILGFHKSTLKQDQGIFKLYSLNKWPSELGDTHVFWFKIQQNPTLEIKHKNITYIYLVHKQKSLPVQSFLRHQFLNLNIPWLENWKTLLPLPTKSPQNILIFPGSGHKAKNWPLCFFTQVASHLNKIYPLSFILGPAEHLIKSLPFPTLQLTNTQELVQELSKAIFVLGNDSGPMHLASLMNIRGICLFGPTDPTIWKPPHLEIISSPLPCSPCSKTAQIFCSKLTCMKKISPSLVLKQSLNLLKKQNQAL
ncbi:ADP-heptose:LPS heptosyltransferase [Desulfonauticus submarinus]|uniref:ADP-heptose:LPS heptosyltransferase n=1 Tax=Desulfonauticus submarinus TaxID=206665 RepID=A0A1H0E8T5_9BACT|nr:glycosyltransferase family 9 protein [Desulfonauticus submarinus]SDN78810.1 ADP-heptose:LPS heptosyltransferase [Desulfonauticus submarinus]